MNLITNLNKMFQNHEPCLHCFYIKRVNLLSGQKPTKVIMETHENGTSKAHVNTIKMQLFRNGTI